MKTIQFFIAVLLSILISNNLNAFDGNIEWIKSGHRQYITWCNYMFDMKYIWSSEGGGFVKIWNMYNKTLDDIIKPFPNKSIGFEYNSKKNNAIFFRDNEAKLYDFNSKTYIKTFKYMDLFAWTFSETKDTMVIYELKSDYFPQHSDVHVEIFIKIWDINKDSVRIFHSEIQNGKYSIEGALGHRLDRAIAISPDGTEMAISNDSSYINIFDFNTTEFKRGFNIGSSVINSMYYSRDGKWIYSSGSDGKIIILDAQTGDIIFNRNDFVCNAYIIPMDKERKYVLIKYINPNNDKIDHLHFWNFNNMTLEDSLFVNTNGVSCYSISDDLKKIICGTSNSQIIEKDSRTGDTLNILTDGNGMPSTVDVNDKYAIAGSDDKKIRIRDIMSGKLNKEINTQNAVSKIKLTPDGNRLAIADGTYLKAWNFQNDSLYLNLPPLLNITNLKYSNDSKFFSVNIDKDLYFFFNNYFYMQKILKLKSTPNRLYFSKDDKYLISVIGKTIEIYNIDSLKFVISFSGHSSNINDLKFIPNSDIFITSSADSTIKFWDLKEMKLAKSIQSKNKYIISFDVTSNGKYLIGACDDNYLYFLNLNSEIWEFSKYATFLRYPNKTQGYLLNVDDKKIFYYSSPCFNYLDFKTIRPINTPLEYVSLVNVEHCYNKKYIILGCTKDTTVVFRLTDYNKVYRGSIYKNCIMSGSATEPLFAKLINSDGNGYEVIDLVKNENKIFYGGLTNYSDFIILNDSKTLISGSTDVDFTTWNIETGVNHLYIPFPSENKTQKICLSSDNKYIARCFFDGSAKAYQINLYDFFNNIDINKKITKDSVKGSEVVTSLKYTPDGQKLLVGLNTGDIDIIDITQEKIIASFMAHVGSVNKIIFSTDGKAFISYGTDTGILFWNFDKLEKRTAIASTFNVTDMSLTKDEKHLLVSTFDGSVIMYNIEGELTKSK